MTRTVVVRPAADADQAGIARFIARRVSVASATSWRRQVEAALVRLATDADQWPEADEAADLGMNLRCRVLGRRPHVYRLLFTIEGDEVLVHRVRHAAQDRLTADDLGE